MFIYLPHGLFCWSGAVSAQKNELPHWLFYWSGAVSVEKNELPHKFSDFYLAVTLFIYRKTHLFYKKSIEVKSGKDYTVHSALDKFLSIEEYNVRRAYVLSNEQKVYTKNGVTYIPIYYIMFFQNNANPAELFLD